MCEENLLGNTSCRIYGLRKEIGLCNGSQLGTYYMVDFMQLLPFFRIQFHNKSNDFDQRLKNPYPLLNEGQTWKGLFLIEF